MAVPAPRVSNGDVTVLEERLTARPRVERVAYVVAAVLVASGLLHLLMFAIEPRPWGGPLSWRKAVTFGVSFGTTLATVTWVTSYLRIAERTRTVLLGVFAVDCVVEVLGITVQAWRHVPSHFNRETPFDAVVATTLAVGGAVLVVTLGVFAVVALRGRVTGDAPMRLALRAGWGLMLLGLASGVAMIVRGTALQAQGHVAESYLRAGYLKDLHGVTLHAVLVLPALAWLLQRGTLPESRRLGLVRWGIAAYVVAVLVALGVGIASY
ncbi:MAG: hypothetical protein JWO46_2077 [Nocardioidaceae bacterium]|nr:hypothetical protein [Nocardioidaceae bacterium]